MIRHLARRAPLPVAPLLAALLLAAGPAWAQPGGQGSSALRGLDTSAPIDVDADRAEFLDAALQAVLTGNVVITQGRMTLKADRVTINYTRSGDAVTMERLDARGRVSLTSPSETITSTGAIYDVPAKLVTMTGNVRLDRQGSVLNGQRLVLNLASGTTSFDARSVQNSQGRISGRFLVPERKPAN